MRHFRRLYADDFLLFLSLASYLISFAIAWQTLPNKFYEMNLLQGLAPITKEFLENEPTSTKLNYAAGSMMWLAVYCVKFAFLAIFRKLIWSVRSLQIWWWIVLVFVSLCLVVSVGIDPWICPDVSMSMLSKACFSQVTEQQLILRKATCTITGTQTRKLQYYQMTTVFDIFSDVAGMRISILDAYQS